MKDEKRICVICGVEFTPRSPSQLLCGSAECKRERHRQYVREHADMYRILNREYRKKEENKIYRAEYDREYQKKNKAKIQSYKRAWWIRKTFKNHLEKGTILKNVYWFSLSKEQQQEYEQQANLIREQLNLAQA